MGHLAFPRNSKVYLDTAPIIYSVEKNPDYCDLLDDIWTSLEAGEIEVVTSELSLLETLVHPIRNDDADLVEAYETLLTDSDVIVVPITTAILRAAVNLRAMHNFKTPDAIHAATAMYLGCSHLVANDSAYLRLVNINVVILSEIKVSGLPKS